MSFRFEHHQEVAIAASGRIGIVIARGDYADGTLQHLVETTTHEGEVKSEWYTEGRLELPAAAPQLAAEAARRRAGRVRGTGA